MRLFSIVFIALFCISIHQESQAQSNFNYGLKAGLTYGTPIGPAEKGATGRPGLGPILGVFGEYNINDKIGVQGEFYFTQKKASFSTPVSEKEYSYPYNPSSNPDTTVYIETKFNGNITGAFDNKYFEVPILFRYKFSERMSILAGPYLGFMFNASNTGTATGNVGFGNLPVEKEPFDESENISRFEYGGALGLRYDTNLGVNIDFRITSGLKSIYKPSYTLAEDVIRNLYLQLTAGYRFQSLSRKDKENANLSNRNS